MKTNVLISCAVTAADLYLCFRLGKLQFSHDTAHICHDQDPRKTDVSKHHHAEIE